MDREYEIRTQSVHNGPIAFFYGRQDFSSLHLPVQWEWALNSYYMHVSKLANS